jgi:putative peptidoglycan lipid II flippase
MKKKYSATVAATSIYIAALGLISKGLGFFREVLFASIYGLSSGFDIYLIGAVLPLTLNVIIICLGQNYIIPIYNKIQEKNSNLAKNFIKVNFYLFLFAGILFSLTMYLFSASIISLFLSNSNPSLNETAVNIFNLFLISIPVTSGIAVLVAYLQSNFEFKYSVASQILPNMVVLLTVYFFRNLSIYAIPIGFVIGTVFQLLLLLNKTKELLLNHFDIINSFKEYKKSNSLTLLYIILIESIGQFYVIIDRYFYSLVPTGAISSLNYASTIFQLPLLIISMALSTAIFPKFSQLIHQKLFTDLEKIFNDSLRVNVIIFIPITFLFIFYGETILRIIFERGNFSSSNTIMTHTVLIYYSLSIVFYSSYGILNKIIYSANLISELLYITLLGITLKIVFNFLLVGKFEHEGLALSTSITYLFFFLSSFFIVYRRIPFINKSIFFKESLYHLLNGIISIIITKQISSMFPQDHFHTLIEIALFLIIFILNIILLKNIFIEKLFQLFKNINFAR